MNKQEKAALKRAVARQQIAKANQAATVNAAGGIGAVAERLRRAGIVIEGCAVIQGNHRIAALKVKATNADTSSSESEKG